MKLIVGLGNPGIFYAHSRHNIGFTVVKYLAKAKKVVLKKEKSIRAQSAKVKIDSNDAILALPVTFMNCSAEAVLPLLRKYKIDLADLLVVCDDLDLEFGKLKIRPHGSSAGHRGIKSIIEATGSNEFSRLRVGIGRPKNNLDPARFVLSRFNKSELLRIPGIIEKAGECAQVWASQGIEKSMNIFNKSAHQTVREGGNK